MSTSNDTFDPTQAFADPVAYLSLLGIDVELILDSTEDLPLAA